MNRLSLFDSEHKKTMLSIKMLCDPDHPDNVLPEYQEASRLCKFLLEREQIYDLFIAEETDTIDAFYSDARCFAMICDRIYHAIVDDGDICFAKVDNRPRILFQSRWEVTLKSASSKYEQLIWQNLKEFAEKREAEGKPIKNLPTPTLSFFNNSREFMEFVEAQK